MSQPPPDPPWVIFDLDGVLANGDSMASLIRRRLFADPARLVAALPLVGAMAAFRSAPAPRGRMARWLVRLGLRGMPRDAYRRLADDEGRQLAQTPGWPIEQGLAALRAHVAAGDRVVVTTGCEEHLAAGFLHGMGVDVPIIASRYREDGGPVYHHNYGPEKLRGLTAEGVPVSGAVFYTDSVADLPVALAAADVRLVNPDARTLRAFERSGARFAVTTWKVEPHGVKSYDV